MTHRANDRAFGRERSLNSKGLTFENLVLLQLTGLDNGYHEELRTFFNPDFSLSPELTPSPSALCQGRKKIKHTVFVELGNLLVDTHYAQGDIKDWHGFRLIGIDGSTLHVPDTKENVDYFGGWRAKNGDGDVCPKARCSFAFDVLNRLIVDAQISPLSTGEDSLALKHMELSSTQDLNIFDRGYASYKLFLKHEDEGLHYCARIPVELFTRLCDEFMESDMDDAVVSYYPTEPIASKCRNEGLVVRPLKIRLIKVRLSTGETEVLATNVFDKRLTVKSFEELYHLRWGVEEEFKRLKCRVEVEQFSGKLTEFVLQDFYADVLRLNISTLISMGARAELERKGKKAKHRHAPDMSHAIECLAKIVDYLRRKLQMPQLKVLLTNITIDLVRNSLPVRPGRTYERKRKPRRSGHFQQYKRTA